MFVWLIFPDDLAIAGLCAVFALSVTRVLNHNFIHEKEMVETATGRAVNVSGDLSGEQRNVLCRCKMKKRVVQKRRKIC